MVSCWSYIFPIICLPISLSIFCTFICTFIHLLYVCPFVTSVCLYFHFRTLTWVNIKGFSTNMICALMLWRSGLGLLMGQFHNFWLSYLPTSQKWPGIIFSYFLTVFVVVFFLRKNSFLYNRAVWAGGRTSGIVQGLPLLSLFSSGLVDCFLKRQGGWEGG